MTARRLLAVDYGARRIGIAASDGAVAVPLTIIEHQGREADLARVAEAVRAEHAAAVVIGLPLLASGEEGEQARRCRRFGEALARRIDAPVVYHDETLTSADAHAARRELAGARRVPGRTRPVDDLAAARILQSYLDAVEGRQ